MSTMASAGSEPKKISARRPELSDSETSVQASDVKSGKLILTVRGGDSQDMKYQVSGTTQLIKLKEHYCSKFKIEYEDARFIYDGIRVQNLDTPEALGMKNGDEIEIYLRSDGGHDARVQISGSFKKM